MGLTDFYGTSALALDKTAFPDDGRSEPRPALASRQTRFAEATRLDPTRVGLGPKPRPAKRRFPYGPIGSFLVHLLPFLLLVEWPRSPPEIETPIPIQLVIEQPPPPPPPPPPAPQLAETKPPAKPPPGRRASDDFGDTEASKVEPAKSEPSKTEAGKNDQPPQEAERQSSDTETQTAMASPSPSSAPTPTEEQPTSKPQAPTETRTVLVAPPPPVPLNEQETGELPSPAETMTGPVTLPSPPPKPAPHKERTAMHLPQPLGSSWPLPLRQSPPRETQRSARYRGPASLRDEYCAEALSLTLKNMGLLPLSLTGARQGETQLSIRVLGDGTINSVKVERSSGYRDIDERVERMVLAVGRFPPLPQWMGPWMDFTFNMHFPHPLQR